MGRWMVGGTSTALRPPALRAGLSSFSIASDYTLNLTPATAIADGWQAQLSGVGPPAESLTLTSGPPAYWRSSVGGYSSVTHYARMRYRLPELANIAPNAGFTFTQDFELPANFYTQNEGYMRFFNTDNFPAALSGGGGTKGAAGANEWRVGLYLYSDQCPRLISNHETNEELVLWKGSYRQLTVSTRHVVTIEFVPSKTTAGYWKVIIDGVTQGTGSNVRTCPTTLTDAEICVTRVVCGIDGAAPQNTKQLYIDVYSATFVADT